LSGADPTTQRGTDCRHGTLVARQVTGRTDPHDAAALGTAVATHLQRLAEPIENHPHEAMAPQLGMVNPVEIQHKKGYHHVTLDLGGIRPPGLGAVGCWRTRRPGSSK